MCVSLLAPQGLPHGLGKRREHDIEADANSADTAAPQYVGNNYELRRTWLEVLSTWCSGRRAKSPRLLTLGLRGGAAGAWTATGTNCWSTSVASLCRWNRLKNTILLYIRVHLLQRHSTVVGGEFLSAGRSANYGLLAQLYTRVTGGQLWLRVAGGYCSGKVVAAPYATPARHWRACRISGAQ
jgi:hypothetical protein